MPGWRRSGPSRWPSAARAKSRSACAATSTARLLKNMYGDKPGLVIPSWPASIATARSSTSSRACATARRAAASRSRRRAARARSRPACIRGSKCRARAERDLKIVCGHWSTLGLFIGHGVHAIDTGAVWGGKLTALAAGYRRTAHGPGAGPRRAGDTATAAPAVSPERSQPADAPAAPAAGPISRAGGSSAARTTRRHGAAASRESRALHRQRRSRPTRATPRRQYAVEIRSRT